MEFHSQRAIFLQIADLLTDGILEKKWSADERIPSVRELAASIEVNPNTVMRAYTFLQDQGIIANKRGIGYFVDSEAIARIIALKRNEFVAREIPRIAKMIKLLGISSEDLMDLLNQPRE
jgi:DNA-binding transcriptional regulator YhcF (GntR family)